MRLSRPQISLKQLLLVVALVALNCGVFRLVYGMVADVHGGYPLLTVWTVYRADASYPASLPSLALAVGLIPL